MNHKDKLKLFDEREHELDAIDAAWAKAALFFRTGVRLGHKDGQEFVNLPLSHRQLQARRRCFEQGDTLELLYAIRLCAEENLPLPEWLALAYCKAFDRFVYAGRELTIDASPIGLDDVFHSKDMPTTSKQKAYVWRRDWVLGQKFWRHTWAVAKEQTGIATVDSAVKAALLADPGFCFQQTKGRELFTRADKLQHEHIGSPLLSQYLKTRRNKAG